MRKDYLKAALAGIYSRAAAKIDQAGDHGALLGAIQESQEAIEEIMIHDPDREEPAQSQQGRINFMRPVACVQHDVDIATLCRAELLPREEQRLP